MHRFFLKKNNSGEDTFIPINFEEKKLNPILQRTLSQGYLFENEIIAIEVLSTLGQGSWKKLK